MKKALGLILLLMFLLSLSAPSAFAASDPADMLFPEGTIVVPQGTAISIDDANNVITITDTPVEITSGDTFIVYLQDLPIGYVAQGVSVQGAETIINAEKADKAVYALLDEEGVVELTPDMYEFIPAPNVTTVSSPVMNSYDPSDSKLNMTVGIGGASAQVSLSNLSLAHSISDGDVSVVLHGNWELSTTMSVSDDSLSEIPLGQLRIGGIGKIAIKLSIDQSLSVSCKLGGSFSAGVTITKEGGGEAVKDFSVSTQSVEGKGSISVSLKVTAGVDVLIAEADLYVEIGVETQFTTKNTYVEAREETIHCDDIKIYLFTNIGAEAKCLMPWGMETVLSAELELMGEDNSPFIINIHFEDGELVGGCSVGMSVPDLHFGGITSSFGSTLMSDGRDRVLETMVDLPWDITIDEDYRIANGGIDLNGHTLTINGDLIHSGGILSISNGTLNVKGNYRLQGETSPGSGVYCDSTGALWMTDDGCINLDGDFILQTNSSDHRLTDGTFNIEGDIHQINTTEGTSSFQSGTGCNFVMSASNSHILDFADARNNSIGWLTMKNAVTSQGSVSLGKVDMNGHKLTVNGTFYATDSIDMQDRDPEPEVFTNSDDLTIEGDTTVVSGTRYYGMNLNGHSLTVNGDMVSTSDIDLNGGILTITGSLYQHEGTIYIHGGKLDVAGSLYIVGSDSVYTAGREAYTSASAALQMEYETDEVRIGGNFVTASFHYSIVDVFSAGTMYIGGNFRQIATNVHNYSNFNSTGTHKVVFNGSGTQTIQFDRNGSGFNTVDFVNPNIELKGNYLRGFTLEDDINLTVSTNELNLYGDMDLNGHSLGSNTIDGDFKINDGTLNLGGLDLTINGDLTLGCELNLEGGTLTVTGTLYQYSNRLSIDGGKLDVKESYYIAGLDSVHTPGREAYTSASAALWMQYETDEVHVGKNFVTASYYSYYKNCFTAGTMYIGGNFRQVGTDNYESGNFDSEGTHKVVFNGSDTQTIQFDSAASGFNIVDFVNPNIELKGNYLRGFTLEDDINLTLSTNELNLNGDMNLNGHSLGNNVIVGDFTANNYSVSTLYLGGLDLTINGDLTLGCDLELEGGTLTVTGTLYQYSNYLSIDGGKLDVKENYYIAGLDSVHTPGREAYTSASAALRMQHETDEVHVGKDFVTASYYYSNKNYYTAGTMYIGGNFRQVGTDNYEYGNFDSEGTHKVVFNGSGTQTIQFDNADSGFNIVDFVNPDIELKGNYLRGFTLEDDINLTVSTNELNLNGDMNLNGHSLGNNVIVGDFTANNYSVSTLNLGGLDLTINGDLTLGCDLELEGGTLTVTGTLYQYSNCLSIDGGKLDVKENYYIAGLDSVHTPGREAYTSASAALQMQYETDEVHVGKDFVTASYYDWDDNYYTAGTMYIGGNFRQVGTDSYESGNFDSEGTHKVVFNGSDTQTIQFDSADSGFNIVDFVNPDIELKGNYLRGFTLEDDINLTLSTNKLNLSGTMNLNCQSLGDNTFDGDLTLIGGNLNVNNLNLSINGNLTSGCDIDLNGYDMTVSGDVTSEANIDLNGGYLSIGGTLYQENGTMHINGGKLIIAESYYMAGADSVYVEGREVYFPAGSELVMDTELDVVTVGANFVTASSGSNELSDGIMYISGNITQVGTSSNFVAENNHRVVLTGTNEQTVQFESDHSTFNVLQIPNPLDSYTFSNTPCWNTLIQPNLAITALPEALTAIEDEAFMNNSGLVVVKVSGSNLTSIGTSAFKGCKNLLQITLPDSVTVIAEDAFDGCTLVTIICSEGSYAQQYADTHGITWKTN